MRLGTYVLAADMPETDRLWSTITAWWKAIEVLLVTGVTNARTEAANTGIKQIKRTGRGYRNPDNYRVRILLASAARTAAGTPLSARPSTRRREEPMYRGAGRILPRPASLERHARVNGHDWPNLTT